MSKEVKSQISEGHKALWKAARKSGQLNLSNHNLIEVPQWVWRVNVDVPDNGKNLSFDASDRWWEQTDLVKLTLAGNCIGKLSEEISHLTALTFLDVRNNCLSDLPESISNLVNLQKLYLSHNKLIRISRSIGDLRNLQDFTVDHNLLTECPEFIGQLTLLENIDLSFNHLSALPSSIGFLKNLSKLSVTNNKLSQLPREIGSLKNLVCLDVTHNQLSSLPVETGHMPRLKQLYLRHNNIGELPVFAFSNELKELHIGNNYITVFSKQHMEGLKSVCVLDLRDNKIHAISEDIVVMQCLERLDVSNNDLSSLPSVLGVMENLKSIVLDGNPLKSLRRDIIMRGTMEIKRILRSRMEEDKIPEIPTGKGIIGAVQDELDPYLVASSRCLDYSCKKVSSVPDKVLEAAVKGAVSVVKLDKNELSSYPESLHYLSESLQELYLSHNCLTNISSAISRLHLLKILDVRNNQLADLPDGIALLVHLRELILSCNRFTKVPSNVYSIPNLEVLLINDNKINSIDSLGFQKMLKLSALNLQNNELTSIPPELGLCSQLRSLQLEGNPLRQPRPAILAKGTPALLEYLKGRIVC